MTAKNRMMNPAKANGEIERKVPEEITQKGKGIRMKDNGRLRLGLEELGIHPQNEQLEQLDRFYDLLIEWNEKMNLTAITDYDEVVVKHFLDSVSLVKIYDMSKPVKILDMGTGAGFPGIPLKILFPNMEFVLMDSLNKRITFLQEVIRQLGLKNITAIHARAEEYARKPEYREQFDLCVSRAVARLSTLTEFCLPFVKKGGSFIPYKSGRLKEELEEAEYAVHVLGGKITKELSFKLADTEIERTYVCIKKERSTPGTYPRAGGKPLKSPLVSR